MKAYLLEMDRGNGFKPFELMVKHIDNDTDISLLEITENGLSTKEYPDVLVTDYNDWDFRLGVDFDINDPIAQSGFTDEDRFPYLITEVEISGELSDKCKEFLENVDGTVSICDLPLCDMVTGFLNEHPSLKENTENGISVYAVKGNADESVLEEVAEMLSNPVDNYDICERFWHTGRCVHNGSQFSTNELTWVLAHYTNADSTEWGEFAVPCESLVEEYVMAFMGRDDIAYVVLTDGIVHTL